MVKFKSCKYCGKSFVQHNINSHYCSISCRFWSKVEISSPYECWEWQGYKDNCKYGIIRIANNVIHAHRIAFELTFNKIPYGIHCLHKCDNPSCVNPFHLFLGTHTDNMIDKKLKNRAHRPIGIINPKAKVTEKQVLDIRSYYNQGCRISDISKFLNISWDIVSNVCKRESWSHV